MSDDKNAINLSHFSICKSSNYANAYFNIDYIIVGIIVPIFSLFSALFIFRKSLIITTEGAGQTNPAPGEYNYRMIKKVQLLAIPSSGWILEFWEIDGKKKIGMNCDIFMLKTHKVRAVFRQEKEQSKREGGTLKMLQPEGSGRTFPDIGEYSCQKKEVLTISAIPVTGWKFKCWYIDAHQVFENNLKIKMNKNRTIQAVFVQNILSEKERFEIQNLISETMQIIAISIREANNSQNTANLKGLDILQRMVEVLYQRVENGQISYIDAKNELLSFQKYAEGLGKPIPTYYDLLKISTKATDKEIKIAFQEVIQQYHPDKFPNLPEWLKQYCEEMTRKLIEARDVLLDEAKRKEYDESEGVS